MANYDQNVVIDLNVKSNIGNKLSSAVGEIQGAKKALEGMDTDLDSTASSLDNVSDAAERIGSKTIAPEIDLTNVSGEIEAILDLAEALKLADEAKDSLEDSNNALDAANKQTTESSNAEAESFRSLKRSADNLSELKDAVTQSNAALDSQSLRSTRSMAKEKAIMLGLSDQINDMDAFLDELVGTQEELGAQSRKTALGADTEAKSFKDLMDNAKGLSGAKQAVSKANRVLQEEADKSAKQVVMEADSFDVTEEQAKKLTQSLNSQTKASGNLSSTIRRMNRSIDSTTDSMRAASQVGDIFSEGLGSLSLNLGAFTIALRNFLTQIPLLITGLGAVGSVALGSAAALGTLAGAMVALPLAGLFLESQRLANEFAGIESASDALSTIFNEIQQVLVDAISPITKAAEEFTFFRDAVESIGFVVSLLSEGFADLTESSETLQSRLPNGEKVATFQNVVERFDGSTLEELVDSLVLSFRILGDEVVTALSFIGSGLAGAIKRSANLANKIGDLRESFSQFGDTISELAELGIKFGGGLLPVLEGFSSVVEDVASSLNELDGEIAANIVTAIAFVLGINKIAGAFSVVVTLLPNVVVGFRSVGEAASVATGKFATFQATVSTAGANIGQFLNQVSLLSGISSLLTSIDATDKRMREIAFSTEAADETFKQLADGVDESIDELRQLAIQAELTDAKLNKIGKDVDDVDFSNTDIDMDKVTLGGGDDGNLIDESQFLPDNLRSLEMAKIESPFRDNFGNQGGRLRNAIGQVSSESDDLFRLYEDDSEALGVFDKKLRSSASALKRSIASTLGLTATKSKLNAIRQKGIALTIKEKIKTVGLIVATNTLNATYAAVNAAQTAYNAVKSKGIKLAIKDAVVKIAGAAANVALAAAEFLATSGALALAAALVVVTGGVFVLLAAVGGLAVGVITNFEKIKSAASDTFGTLKEILAIVVDILLTVFIETWNIIAVLFESVVAAVQPLISVFGELTAGTEKAGESSTLLEKFAAAADVLVASLKILSGGIQTVIAVVGTLLAGVSKLIKLALLPVIVVFQGLFSLLDFVAGVITTVTDRLLRLGGVGGGLQTVFNGLSEALSGFIELVRSLPGEIAGVLNSVIGFINTIVDGINKIPGIQIGPEGDGEFLSKIELGANTTTREELADDTANLRDSTEPKGDNTIQYNEDNSTNIDQTVNADPEDQAQLSRVVTDAINEANSFERRRQGGQ